MPGLTRWNLPASSTYIANGRKRVIENTSLRAYVTYTSKVSKLATRHTLNSITPTEKHRPTVG